MYAYATRGLGFLVRCATISRQLHVGQGRLRSGGSPLFMINHNLLVFDHFCIVSDHAKLKFCFGATDVSPAADSYIVIIGPGKLLLIKSKI